MAAVGRYKMGTFARLTGFSAAVLRAWERRYELLEPERLPGGHRLYTDDDLRLIRRVKQQLETGRSIGEIAIRGRGAILEEDRPVGESREPASRVWVHAPERSVAGRGAGEPVGGETLDALQGLVVRAAEEIDADLLRKALDDAFARVTPGLAIERVIVPAAREIGARWARGTLSVAGEHLVSSHLVFRLRQLLETANTQVHGQPPVLCACLPEEQHELGLLVVALRLASSGRRLVYLGPSVPYEDLQQACERLQPLAVCLSVSRRETFVSAMEGLARFGERHAASFEIYVGGPGVPQSEPTLERAGLQIWPAGRDLAGLLEAMVQTEQRPGQPLFSP